MGEKLSIDGIFTKQINFAMQQNYVPIIRDLVITNETEENLKELYLNISFSPDFANTYEYTIEEIKASESLEIQRLKIQMKTEYLFSLTEKILGSIKISVSSGDAIIYSTENEIELLAYDQWSGVLVMPEIVSAFVMPNHPLINKVITKASDYLKQWTQSPSFTGYQTNNPENVKLQMAAIYCALQNENIIYNNPPASFECIGQRIRFPHIVLEQKIGTCLDLTILYASCLEAVGLYPLLCFVDGHAFGGCWLEENSFADCVIDDSSALTNRLVDGSMELLLLECVDFVSGKNIDFDKATKHGKDHIISIEKFHCLIDVNRTRSSGIRPMPSQFKNTYTANVTDTLDCEQKIENNEKQAPKSLNNIFVNIEIPDDKPITKQKIWERKLLDFSLRNTLLNFRATKNSFQILTADLSELEDRLSDGKDFRIMEIPTEFTPSLRDLKMFEIETEKDLIQSIAMQEFKSFRIRTFLPEDVLEKTLKNLYRDARKDMEESGTNTLFLALGFLKWYESDLSEKARFAPIILIPVDIVHNRKNKGFVIRSRQEDAQINVTLLEYLKQDHNVTIGGLDPLPLDEHGINLQLVFHLIRQGIMGKKRWTIENMAFVGLFSFGQFVMWNDIHSHLDKLEENKIVSSLIDGNLTWQPIDTSDENQDIEECLQNMAVPVSADSSQMKAIASTASGQSFVLHGPPGTGKSQTITNMIANALFQGKTVLFVAEKMAALNVVQKRLENIGLAPFCLELHSNKTKKSTVLASLNNSLEVGKIKSPIEYETASKKVAELRSQLNDTMKALHLERIYGCSLYNAIALFEKNKNFKDIVNFNRSFVEQIDKIKIDQYNESIRKYVVSAKEVGIYNEHPFKNYKGCEYSIEKRENFSAELNKIVSQFAVAKDSFIKISNWIGEDIKSKSEVQTFINYIDLNSSAEPVLKDLIFSENYNEISVHLQNLIDSGLSYKQQLQKILTNFDESVLDFDGNAGKLSWKEAQTAWLVPKMLKENKLIKELNLHAKQNSFVNKENIVYIYDELIALKQTKNRIIETPITLTQKISGLFFGLETDWLNLSKAKEKTTQLKNMCKNLSTKKRTILLSIPSQIENEQIENLSLLNEYMELIENFQTTYELDFDEINEFCIDKLQTIFLKFQESIDKMHSMIDFNIADRNLAEIGLYNICQAYKNNLIKCHEIESTFICNLYYSLILMTISSDSRLIHFNGKQYDDIVSQYKEMLEKYQQLTIQELVARLSAKIPSSLIESAVSSEMGILKKAIKSNGRMLSLRKLFDQIPVLLRKLSPCMLMSPISVAQYINPANEKFDLIIFDEASQLPTSEAIGAISRGKNVVVVGDPKQLPPTNFFSSNRVDEENIEKEDLESLLDDCLAISMPEETLKWHYRSRHESLIAYSNMKYYDNKLYTFPSPSDLTSEVRLVQLDGYYDKGKTKQNLAEAKAIVSEIIRRLQDERLRNDSIGVVTFSSVQQNLIDDMLLEEFQKHPDLEEFDQNSKEPIFVKNLENVQGDERDVILFSIGYGPDLNGKVSMNFGPLNRDGGWRRLNVAISRARKSMTVYSVLKPEQIDLSRTRSDGIAGLKGFLEFASRGKNPSIYRPSNADLKEDYLVKELVSSIAEMGYLAKENVGSSEYKVDLAVIDPKNPSMYILGILIDGENSKKTSTARDRFVSQPAVLGSLGWQVIRVWALDWLDDSNMVKNYIQSSIEDAVANRENNLEICSNNNVKDNSIIEMMQSQVETLDEQISVSSHIYETANLIQESNPDGFYSPINTNLIQTQIKQILEIEAPISKKLLVKKVLSLWGIARGGAKVESVFADVIKTISVYQTNDDERIFYWNSQEQSEILKDYRVATADGLKRNFDDIPSQEIHIAMTEVLSEQISLSESDLIREIAKKFDFSRIGNVIENTISPVINFYISKNEVIKLPNGNISLA